MSSFRINDVKPKLKDSVRRQKERCCICKRHTCDDMFGVSNGSGDIYFFCRKCNKFFFKGLYYFEKGPILIKALKVSSEENIYIPYALNAIRGRYTLKEAKKRTRLREREQQGKSTDLYNLGKRTPGSFRSKK